MSTQSLLYILCGLSLFILAAFESINPKMSETRVNLLRLTGYIVFYVAILEIVNGWL
jgi:hypothetical protein